MTISKKTLILIGVFLVLLIGLIASILYGQATTKIADDGSSVETLEPREETPAMEGVPVAEGSGAQQTEAPSENAPVENPKPNTPEPVVVDEPGDDPVFCTADAKQCPDGTYVSRQAPSCAFAECPPYNPPADPVVCTADVKECPDGTYVNRVAPNCEFAACPITQMQFAPPNVVCTADVKECPDGTYVNRVAPNCEFAACPLPKMQFQF